MTCWLHLSGKVGAILTGERTALNFLGRLSGIATLTRRFVEQLAGTRAKIRDTRKTTPGLRLLEKYAVRMGGGTNHRIGLFDAILLKENHIALAGGVKAAMDQAHAFASAKMKPRAMTAYEAVGTVPSPGEADSLPIQIEVRTEPELREALGAGAESVLAGQHDSGGSAPLRGDRAGRARRLHRGDFRRHHAAKCSLVCAKRGGLSSAGALTHSARAADVSLLVDSIKEK